MLLNDVKKEIEKLIPDLNGAYIHHEKGVDLRKAA